MDPERFDGLIRSLSSGSSRRGVVSGLASGLLGLLPLLSGSEPVVARRKRRK